MGMVGATMILPGEKGKSGLCGDATTLRDSLVVVSRALKTLARRVDYSLTEERPSFPFSG